MAATQLQQYALLYITVKGSLLTEAAQISVDRDSKASIVETLAKGMAGVTPGAGTTSLQVSNMVPAADFELNGGTLMSTYTPAEIGVLGPGGKQLIVDCFLISDSLKSSVNNSSTYDMTLLGPFADWR